MKVKAKVKAKVKMKVKMKVNEMTFVKHKTGVKDIEYIEFRPLTRDQLDIEYDKEPFLDPDFRHSNMIVRRAFCTVPAEVMAGLGGDQEKWGDKLHNAMYGYSHYKREVKDMVRVSVAWSERFDYRGCRNQEQRDRRLAKKLAEAKEDPNFSSERLIERLVERINNGLRRLAQELNNTARVKWARALSSPEFVAQHAAAALPKSEYDPSKDELILGILDKDISVLEKRAQEIRKRINLMLTVGASMVISDSMFVDGEPIVPEEWLEEVEKAYDSGRCLPNRNRLRIW